MAKSKVNRLKNQSDAAIASLEAALAAQRRFGENAVRLCERLELDAALQADAAVRDAGMNSPELRDWLCQGVRSENIKWCRGFVGTAGSGPWNIDEFDAFLAAKGFELAYLPQEKLGCVVLGCEGWDEDALAEQIYGRDGSELIVLSQPLFVAGLLRNVNPLEAMDRDVLLALAATHPALSFIADRGFDWLFETESNSVSEWEPNQELAEKSPLRLAGYSVASGGPGELARRDILESFFFDRAPKGIVTEGDRERWGSSMSAQRLYGMATFIAWLCRFQGSNAPQAVARWKDDLDWLKREFFKPAMQFEWPSAPRDDKAAAQSVGVNPPQKPMFSLGPPAPAATRAPASKSVKTNLSPAAAWPFPTGNEP